MRRSFSVNIFLTMLALALYTPAKAYSTETPSLKQPIECTLGENCWITNYPDTAPEQDSAKDFTCGALTKNNHNGTDFAVSGKTEMNKGINALAAADAKVLRVRDGESDSFKTEEQLAAIRASNKDCGNGVILDHGNGLQTYYCHLKLGSISVKPGAQIKQGDKIGQIGNSGASLFPHLYFSVIWEGGYIDPFTGSLVSDGCGQDGDQFWEEDIPYDPFPVFNAGFANTVPDFANLQKNGHVHPESLSPAAEKLLYWVGFYQAQAGDNITLTITAPDGSIFAKRETTLDESRTLPSYQYTGRALNGRALQTGTYTGTATFKREGVPERTLTHSIEIR